MNAARPAKTLPHTTARDRADVSAPENSAIKVRTEIINAIHLLLAAFNYARDAQSDAWQFAVEIDELRPRGLSLSDLRWLLAKGFAEHRREVTIPGDTVRSFRPLAATDFPQSTAVILSAAGAQFLALLVPAETRRPNPLVRPVIQEHRVRHAAGNVAAGSDAQKPVWNGTRRELYFGALVVKRFRVPAANQETILQSFQEEDWPHCIDDPLPPTKESDSKGRLSATIKSLNRNQINALIKFHGNGNGQQIYWAPHDQSNH
jgi:hypothetical protein